MATTRALLGAVLTTIALLALTGSASATTFTVTKTTDSNDGSCTPALCSLRDAVTAANAANGNTVTVPAGTYSITLGVIAFNSDMTIAGTSGARSTVIDAGGLSRIFDFDTSGPGTSTLTLQGLTLRNGNSGSSTAPFVGDGGAIIATGTLDLNDVTLTGNTATESGGAVMMPPESGVTNSFSMQASTATGNRVTGGAGNGQGGAIGAMGNVRIVNSTITGNSVSDPGLNEGGGIVAGNAITPGETTSLINTTVADNTVSGPGTDFGGGISGDNFFVGSTGSPVLTQLTALNTIIADNTVDGARQDCGLTNTVSTTHDLSSDATCNFTGAGDKQNTEPRLGALANNGGDTDTQAIATGSPAVDAGTNSGCPATDQRGVTRPQNGICDIGAFEYVPAADLAMTETVAPTRVTVGGSLTFTLSIVNAGPDTATGATLSDQLPAGISLVSATPSQGSCSAGSALTCSLGTLASGAVARVAVVVKTTQTGSVTNAASVRADQPDPNAGNNAATATATAVAVPLARIAKLGVPGCVKAGTLIRVRVAGAKQVSIKLNGHTLLRTKRRSFTVRLSGKRLRAKNVVKVIAVNSAGRRTTRRVVVRRCTVATPRFTG